ncbi:MAG: hypothetical protein V4501_08500 [Pseudomonadota bacterium]
MNDTGAEKAKWSFIFCVAMICLLAWYIHQQLFISWDISALLHATEKLLQGGNYIDDFFIPNTPMILYLYIPPVVLAKLLHSDVLMIFPLYIFSLVAISFLVCYRLITRIFLKEDLLQQYIFASVLALVFLIVPIYEFGQRDHLLVIMAMPYLLTMVCRLQAEPINRYLAIAIGIFAGFGIAIKPQFLILPAVMETYYLYAQRSWTAWIRPEVFAMIAVQVLYLLLLLITRQDYVAVMIPYLVKYYYGTSLIPWSTFLLNDTLLFIYASLVFYIFLHKMNQYKKLSAVLFVALLSFLSIYLLQGFVYFYHMVPALSLAILMLVQLYTNIVVQNSLTGQDYKAITILAICLLLLQAFLFNVRFSLTFIDPSVFFVLFTLFFSSLVLIFKFRKPLLIILAAGLYIVLASYWFLHKTMDNTPYFVQIFLTLCMLLLLLKTAFGEAPGLKLQRSVIALLGILLFIVPSWIVLSAYEVGLQYKSFTLNKLIDFIHTLPPHESIYMFSSGIHFTFPMASYTDVVVVQRFDAMWMVRGFLKQIIYEPDGREMLRENIRNNTSKTFILNMVVDDLRNRKPDLIFVETKYPGQKSIMFNFLEYFLENKAFSQVWKNYHYLTSVEEPGTFKLDVYKLNEATSTIYHYTLPKAHAPGLVY